jgi:hypothetical protein
VREVLKICPATDNAELHERVQRIEAQHPLPAKAKTAKNMIHGEDEKLAETKYLFRLR